MVDKWLKIFFDCLFQILEYVLEFDILSVNFKSEYSQLSLKLDRWDKFQQV